MVLDHPYTYPRAQMRDGWAGYSDTAGSPYVFEGLRWQRFAREPPLVSRNVALVILASLLLLGVAVSDVGAYYATPVKVTITQINWFVGNTSVANGSGFTVPGGHDFSLTLVCKGFCVEFVSVSVNRPFALVNATEAYPWYEYVNVTIQAPSSTYEGPLSLSLAI